MHAPGVLQTFVGAATVADGASALTGPCFTGNRDANRLSLFISLSGGAGTATLQPVYRRTRQPEEDPIANASDVQAQYEGDEQQVALTAAGNYFRQFSVPRGFEVAVRVFALGAGATVTVLGHFEQAT